MNVCNVVQCHTENEVCSALLCIDDVFVLFHMSMLKLQLLVCDL